MSKNLDTSMWKAELKLGKRLCIIYELKSEPIHRILVLILAHAVSLESYSSK